MEEKYIFYDVDGKQFKIPESRSSEFEKDAPNAKINYSVNGKNFSIGLDEKEEFLNDVGDLDWSYANFEEERPSVFETVGKAGAAAGVTLGKQAVDLTNVAAKQGARIPMANSPLTGLAATIESLTGKSVLAEDSPLNNASVKMGETAERLSKEADPTGGEKDFIDLVKDGNIGLAIQKGIGTSVESLPIMLATKNPYTAGLWVLGSAASGFEDERRNNPDIPAWKAGVNSLLSSTLELAIEKIADPLEDLFKAGKGELTEEVAKGILDKVTKEGSENIAKRIFNYLKGAGKKIGKNALGEGFEEGATSLGNDAIGSALDAIDGNKDYGFSAQWEQYKEENPDADLWDFSKAKARQYLNDAIGGAFAGANTSAVASTLNDGVNLAIKKSDITAGYERGFASTVRDIYDIDGTVKEAEDNLVNEFVDENGDATISREFFNTLSAEQAYDLAQKTDIPSNQRTALRNYAVAKAQQEGINAKLDGELADNIKKQNEYIDSAKEDGFIVTGFYNNQPVYIKGGVFNNGAITLPNGEAGPVIVVNTLTGEKSTVLSNEIQNPSSLDVDTYREYIETQLRENDAHNRDVWRNTKSESAKQKEFEQYVGSKILINTGEGLAEVEVKKLLPNGLVLIKGKKGDLGGHSEVVIPVAQFYDSIYRNDDGTPASVEPIKDGEQPEGIQPTQIPANETPDYRGENVTIIIDGTPVEVEVTGQDNVSDTITYEYTDVNGNRRSGSSTIGAFTSAVKQDVEPSPEEVQPEISSDIPEVEDVTPEPVPVEETPLEPESINWDELFERDKDAYLAELQKQFGDETLDILNEEIDAAQRELDALAKAKTSSQNERLENRKKRAGLQDRIAALNDMVAKMTPPVETSPEVPAEPDPVSVVSAAPNPVENPIEEAKKKEAHLYAQIQRHDLPSEQKQDLAFSIGKKVADLFATREEYDIYAEDAADLGVYNADFERGVDESFANRPQNAGVSPVNSVPLGSQPKEQADGEKPEDAGIRQGTRDNSGSTSDEGAEADNQGTEEDGKGEADKGKVAERPEHKYPARKKNATQQLLVDTFGFESVTIPNSRKDTLNSIYDFMMEMSKMLGISPKSIGQGGWLSVANLRANNTASAMFGLRTRISDGSVISATLQFKYAKLTGLAHEWWHALDHALRYFNTGKGRETASEISKTRFDGREEVYNAIQDILSAIKDSGHTDRMLSLNTTIKFKRYLVEPTELLARAFDAYINDKFIKAGISVEGTVYDDVILQPTPEEMESITPQFDKLFEILQEKEGKTPGTSILYHIGEEMDSQSDAKKFATSAILTALDDGNKEVEILSDEKAEQYLKAIGADPKTQFSIKTNKPIFISNAELAVIGIKQEKATPEQWLKMIEKAGGLKAGEDKWMGLSDWLKASDNKTLTKQEVLDYIKENTIQVEEVNYSEINYNKEDSKQVDVFKEEFEDYVNSWVNAGSNVSDATALAYERMAVKYGDKFQFAFMAFNGKLYVNDREEASKLTGIPYSSKSIDETRLGYTTAGLDNLKEIALVVPTIESWNRSDLIHFGDAGDGRAVAWVRFGDLDNPVNDSNYKRLQEIYDRLDEIELKVQSSGISMEEYEERARLREERDKLQEIETKTQKVLVIDEIQSKRHQEGRESGYRSTIEKATADYMLFMARMHEKYDFDSSTPFADVFNAEELDEIARLDKARSDAYFQKGIPDAPFDKNWHELAMKRMLRYAAENGYDVIAWTKGDQQAERYNIGDVVTSVDYRLNNDGTYHVDTIGRNGYQMEGIPTTFNSETELAEIFGKDIARKIAGILENDKQAIAESDKEIDELREWFSKNTKTDEADLDSLLESAINNPEQSKRWNELEVKKEEARKGHSLSETDFRIGGEGMKGFYDKMLPSFMNKYGKKWGVKVEDIELPNVEEAGRIMHSVPVTEAMKASVMEGQPMFYKTPNGIVYGWTDGKKIYLTEAGLNPNTPIHEYTHLWAKAMMQRNPKGWNNIKKLLKGTPVWDEVMNDVNYSNIHNDEDAVASEALSRISGSENAAKMEQMAQKMIDEAKGTARKLEARGLIQNMRDALNAFWEFVWTDLFNMTYFRNIEHVTDRVLFDLLNNTDLGTLSEGQVETQIVTDPKVIAELEASPKTKGFRNVVQNEDGTFSSPMAYWLQSTKGGAKSRIETAKFELGKWEEAEEHPELVDESGHVTLVKPNKKTVSPVAYDPYIHNRLEPVNLQFKEAWKRSDLVYVETEVADTDLESGYHADKAKLPVGVHSWSNGAVMLSKYDKPVRVMPWDEVADAWAVRLDGNGVEFDVVPAKMRSLLVERGVEILPPHKNTGKECNDAYEAWKNENNENILSRKGEKNVTFAEDNESKDGYEREPSARTNINGEWNPDGKGMANDAARILETAGGRSDIRVFEEGLESSRSSHSDDSERARREAESERLVKIAKDNGLFIPIKETEKLGDRVPKKTGESTVYINEDAGEVYKVKDPYAKAAMKALEPEDAIREHVAHNILFPETYYSLKGISEEFGEVRLVLSQKFVDATQRPTRDAVVAALESKGLYPESKYTFGNDYISVIDVEGDNVLLGEDGTLYFIDPIIKFKKPASEVLEYLASNQTEVAKKRTEAQNAAVEYLAGDARVKAIENAVNEEAKKLGVQVTYKTRSEMPAGHKNDKGYYNTSTGEIVICTENASSIADAIQTILHEAVAHKGLRQLMGYKFNEFINRVYNSLDAETKAKVDILAAEQYDGNTDVATEEYMASLAESENFKEQTIWERIKTIFNNVVNKILGRNDIELGDNELRYLLRASYNNMVNPRGMSTYEGWAKDMMMREEYGIDKLNTQTPEILSRTGIDPTAVARATAASVYDKVVSSDWQEFQRQFQDAMQPVRIAIDAIQQETGNIPIEDYENYLLIQNQSSSRSRVEIDKFARRYYTPIINQVNAIIDEIMEMRGLNKNDRNARSEVYKEVRSYLIAKHGLERNKYYQEHKTRPLTAREQKPLLEQASEDYNEKINQINSDTSISDAERELQLREALDEYNAKVIEIKTREVPDMRDYSGLTSLFGLDAKNFEEAEQLAQDMVNLFESSVNTDELWKKINAATDKTLRHSYESGLLSRQQYNDIKSMFKFYIPLRGFDETTAEDVYSYARFEGNRFNPAVKTAEGRTSIADDPIAIIMNMAESEIAQGNKNRAKQALYNYLLNRASADNHQNSLMQVEDVWYVVSKDEFGNEVHQIAAPDHESGETYEQFESRMRALADEEKAYKSKKGKVDVGMRFQKQMNRNAHYVYLKVNGADKAIFINGDPKAADAINGTYQQKKQFGEDKMRDINRLLSSTFTNYSLEFTARNYFRDMIYSHINIGVRESDPAYRKKFRQNWRHNNLGTMIRMLNAYRAGEYEGRPLNEDEAAFVEFMENGGQTGYTVINSVETHKKDLEKAIERMQTGIEKGGVKDSTAFRFTLGAIELLNESSELVTRFAAYKTSRDLGRGVAKSISDAKEVTVNFNTKGAQDGTGWMGAVARYFGWSKFFFNASVQGVQNIAAMAKANALKFGTVVGGVAAAGFLVPIITSAISELFGGDEDEYWNIPEYDRQNNLCIVIGKDKYVKIPLPVGFREVYALGDMVAAMLMDKAFTRDVNQVGMDMANKIASVVLPINPLESQANGLNFWHTFLYTTLPSSTQFAIQNATNIDWKGAPLQKEYTYNENDPSWMKAFASNPDWMKGLSKWCNEHINLDGDYKGVDWSPEKLDNTLSNLFGGIYSLIKKTGRSVSMIWNEEQRNLSNIPLSGVVLGSGIESDDRFVNDAYFEMKDYYDSNVGYVKRIAEKFGYDLDDVFIKESGKHHPKMMDIYNNRNFGFMQEWYLGNEELNEINNDIKKLNKKVAEKDKPSIQLLDELAKKKNELEAERRDFVNDMLELD